MERNGEGWELIINLKPGLHLYKYVVDGLWYWDYEQPYTEFYGLINNIINVPPPIDCKKLVIIRGVSGSGKTTLAKKYLLKYGSYTFAEADQFMVDSAGNYSFNPKQLNFAHESCAKKVENGMKNEENLIVVSNTSIQYWEMYTYVILAQKYGYDLEFTETDTEWRYNPQVLFEKSNHSVPLETIHRQLENLKNNPTLLSKDMMIERILFTHGFRPTNYRPGLGTLFSKLIYYAFPSSEISEWIEKFKSHVGPERYSLYCRNKFQRDGGPADDGNIYYHITLTKYAPDDQLTPEQTSSYLGGLRKIIQEVKPQFVGVGMVQYEGNESYYCVVKWDEVNRLRESLGLVPLNLHVTLGFHKSDVYNVPKTTDTLIS